MLCDTAGNNMKQVQVYTMIRAAAAAKVSFGSKR